MLFFCTFSSTYTLNLSLLSHSFLPSFLLFSHLSPPQISSVSLVPPSLIQPVTCISHLSLFSPSRHLSLNVPLLSSSYFLSSFPIWTSLLSKSHIATPSPHSFAGLPLHPSLTQLFPPLFPNLSPKSPVMRFLSLPPCILLSLLPFLSSSFPFPVVQNSFPFS